MEISGPDMGLGLGFSGLRPKSVAVLSCDGVYVEDLSPHLLTTLWGARASALNMPNEDVIERSSVDVVDPEPNSFGKGD